MEFILFKTLHLVSVLVLFACLFAELLLIQKEMPRSALKRLSIIDAVYGFCSVLILITGFYIALRIGKGRDFYFDNPAIYIKLVLFICLGLLSIYPTLFFLKNRKGLDNERVSVPDSIKKLILLETLLVLSIPLFAVSLAQGKIW
jgi:putative membrane protein